LKPLQHSITLPNLLPFSLYRITIVAVGIAGPKLETRLEISTPSGVPQTRPQRANDQVFTG
jgi:hypothetical protein